MRSVDGFDPDDAFVVARPFKLSGAWKYAGEPVDKAEVSPRLLRQLYGSGEIRRDRRPPVAAAPPEPEAEPAEAPEAEDPEPEPPPVSLTPATIKHIGFGRFVVDRDGARLAGPMTKAEALRALEAAKGAP